MAAKLRAEKQPKFEQFFFLFHKEFKCTCFNIVVLVTFISFLFRFLVKELYSLTRARSRLSIKKHDGKQMWNCTLIYRTTAT